MWTSYSARHAAQLIGLPESAVRSCIKDGLVGAPGAVPAQLSFRDLSALRRYRELRVYVPDANRSRAVTEMVADLFPAVRHIEMLHADLCRPELLVEIEGVAELPEN